MNKFSSFLPVLLLVFFADQSSKFLAGILGFSITYNSGVSFSFMTESQPKFLTFVLFLLLYFLYMSFKPHWKRNPIATGLFFGGAVSNLFDRIVFDSVRDWVNIPFTQIQNNVADWAIFIGLVLIVQPIVFAKMNKD